MDNGKLKRIMSETQSLKVISEYSPMGDQPAAIDGLVQETRGVLTLY